MSRRYLVRRLLLVIPVLLGVMLLVFGMVFLTPGDPITRLAGNKPLPASTIASIKASYHLDRPFLVQFLLYVKGVLHCTQRVLRGLRDHRFLLAIGGVVLREKC